jgi:hypothetical protein
MKLSTLKKQAQSSTKFRGHSMKWDAPIEFNTRSVQIGRCTACGAEVALNTRPFPNEINIGGEAVAINCMDVRL